MSDGRYISTAALAELVSELAASGTRVIAPVASDERHATYAQIESLAEASFNGPLPMPSLKAHFLPPGEALFSWRQHGGDYVLESAPTTFMPQVVLGARPCDVSALAVVDKVMNWDYGDAFWNGRRAASTIIAMACPGIDDSCFCTTVGLGPDSAKGADVLLVPAADGFLAYPSSEKGETFLAEHTGALEPAGEAQTAEADAFRSAATEKIAPNLAIDTDAIAAWIDSHFDDEFWPTLGPRCNGCGACASVCPTCHCFDIVDEPAGVGAGVRRRNWDTCQARNFTLHASGHNPRNDQTARHRQRVSHKFYIYPSKFDEVLCPGCGRCARYCPTGQDMVEILETIDAHARSDKEGAA